VFAQTQHTDNIERIDAITAAASDESPDSRAPTNPLTRPAPTGGDETERCASSSAPRPVSWQVAVKRLVDLVGALGLLCASSPLLVAAGAMVKATSPGRMLYEWRIVGQNGRPIRSFKFRTMVEDADERKKDLLTFNEMSGPVFKMTRDPRVTRIGRLLRKTSIDEMPSLWSVLKGDMSLVGPRPPLQTEYSRFTAHQRRKLEVRPGLTCRWQVNGRNHIADFDTWVEMDLAYIREWSLLEDFKILVATVPAVFRGHGAS